MCQFFCSSSFSSPAFEGSKSFGLQWMMVCDTLGMGTKSLVWICCLDGHFFYENIMVNSMDFVMGRGKGKASFVSGPL